MIHFEPMTEKTLYIAKEMMNSNSAYNILENGHPTRSDEEIQKEFNRPKTVSLLIKADDTYIGVVNYMPKNPTDNHTWIGLFLIHGDYHGFGYGTMAYAALEELFHQDEIPTIRLGVLENNTGAKRFWERNGYVSYQVTKWNNKNVQCYEKVL